MSNIFLNFQLVTVIGEPGEDGISGEKVCNVIFHFIHEWKIRLSLPDLIKFLHVNSCRVFPDLLVSQGELDQEDPG